MSRKRANIVSQNSTSDESNPRKRLHAGLAADFRSLRLSAVADKPEFTSHQSLTNAFGTVQTTRSPFLPSAMGPLTSSRPENPDPVTFGSDFHTTLPTYTRPAVPYNPAILQRDSALNSSDAVSPFTAAASMAFDQSDRNPAQANSVLIEEVGDDELPDADLSTEVTALHDPDDEVMHDTKACENVENRVILYRPPVRTDTKTVARLNCGLPPSQLALRTPSQDWFISGLNDAHKRHMAVIPYVGQPRPSKRRRDVHSHPVIPMPWTNNPSASSVAASVAAASSVDETTSMFDPSTQYLALEQPQQMEMYPSIG